MLGAIHGTRPTDGWPVQRLVAWSESQSDRCQRPKTDKPTSVSRGLEQQRLLIELIEDGESLSDRLHLTGRGWLVTVRTVGTRQAAFRDANLLVVSLSDHSQTIQAGVGVSPETIAPPPVTLSTIAYLKPELNLPNATRKWADYCFEPKPGLVPVQIFNPDNESGADRQPQMEPYGPWISDWKALDALLLSLFKIKRIESSPRLLICTSQHLFEKSFLTLWFSRHLLFNRLKLPKPPLAQHILLSIPPKVSNPTRDKLTQLFFENLQAPALFMIESPLLNILGCNSTSGITVDVGSRSTLIGFISDTILLNHCCFTYPIGEEDCDNFLISLLLSNDPNLPTKLNLDAKISAESLYQALSSLVSNLKSDGHVRFEPSLETLNSAALRSNAEEEDNGITDVAQAIVSGKADKIIGRQISAGSGVAGGGSSSRKSAQLGKRLQAEILKETDTIIVSAPSIQDQINKPTHTSTELDRSAAQVTAINTDFGPGRVLPCSTSGEGIEISKIRHRHAEPMFAPSLLNSIPLVFSKFGLEKWAKRYESRIIEDDGSLPRSIVSGLQKVFGKEQRKDVSQNIMITGASGAMCQTEGLLLGLSTQLRTLTNSEILNSNNGIANGANNQHENFKPIQVPDYFSEFKGRNDWIGYLGGCIVAKLVFNDASSSKLWMSKPDYTKEGPYICRKIGGLSGIPV
ncbi:actin-domain-containing protein [Phakopsora pachyrhizi]|uniref:Actin-domain-containing protein n=1 Tax=Phakopsora pachyrhizi TaxID=170000 RepID=A0AAV0AQR1_PHAPC|nr:actin-domain-containing protein [Phakopsora pachyrhizi]CAH7671571.1 actin-domain-containing protein [Phakopsora pachyrhizi]